MEFERDVAPGVHRIEDAYVNWYLVEEEVGICAVDAGHPSSWDSLHEVLRELGRAPADVLAVVLTHAHFDHVGFAERARRELGARVLVHADDLALARDPWNYEHERSRLPYAAKHPSFDVAFAAMAAAGATGVRGVESATTFADGATLDVPGSPQVVHVPGHTDGQCALHYPERDLLIVGDAIVTRDPYTAEEGPRIVAGAATKDSAQALESLDRLATLDATTVLTGHGPAWRDGIAEAVTRARTAGPS